MFFMTRKEDGEEEEDKREETKEREAFEAHPSV